MTNTLMAQRVIDATVLDVSGLKPLVDASITSCASLATTKPTNVIITATNTLGKYSKTWFNIVSTLGNPQTSAVGNKNTIITNHLTISDRMLPQENSSFPS